MVIIVLLVVLLRRGRAAPVPARPAPTADPLADVDDAGDVRTARVAT